VSPETIGFDELGKGEDEGKAPAGFTAAPSARMVSKGLVRGKSTGLMAIQGGADTRSDARGPLLSGQAPGAMLLKVDGATALKGDVAQEVERAMDETGLASLGFQPAAQRREANASGGKRAEALMKGYQGDACGECGNFTLLRNGTCMKCDTCGSTTGCS
jgi:ribonucleoside-diphosphate reductase alpha chain